MSEIIADHLKDREEISIYDPTSGSGSLLINIGHSVAKHLKKRGQHRSLRPRADRKHLQPPAHESGDARHFAEQYFLHPQCRHFGRRLAAGRRAALSGCRGVQSAYSQPWNPKDKETTYVTNALASPRKQEPILPFYCTTCST